MAESAMTDQRLNDLAKMTDIPVPLEVFGFAARLAIPELVAEVQRLRATEIRQYESTQIAELKAAASAVLESCGPIHRWPTGPHRAALQRLQDALMAKTQDTELAKRIRAKLPQGIHLMPGVTADLGAWYLYNEETDTEIRKHVKLTHLARELKVFNRVWLELAIKGACDALGGAEYNRVCGEWLAADAPEDTETFIRVRANVGLAGVEREDEEGKR